MIYAQAGSTRSERFQYSSIGVEGYTLNKMNGHGALKSYSLSPRTTFRVEKQKPLQQRVCRWTDIPIGKEFEFQQPMSLALPIPRIEVILERAPRELNDIAKELGAKPEIINLSEDVLTPIGKNLFARKTGNKGIEFFEVIE